MAPTDGLTIDIARPDDADGIADLYLASRADALPYLRRVHGDDHMWIWVHTVIMTRGTVLVARRDRRVLGFLALIGDDIE